MFLNSTATQLSSTSCIVLRLRRASEPRCRASVTASESLPSKRLSETVRATSVDNKLGSDAAHFSLSLRRLDGHVEVIAADTMQSLNGNACGLIRLHSYRLYESLIEMHRLNLKLIEPRRDVNILQVLHDVCRFQWVVIYWRERARKRKSQCS